MSPTGYMIWFVFMAAATGAILVLGTLGATGLFSRNERSARSARRAAERRGRTHVHESLGWHRVRHVLVPRHRS